MKKFILLLFTMILIFGFVGCNSSASEIDLDMDEFISNPTNLVISGTTLSWDAVEDAAGYIVYANSEEVDKVKTTSYDFGDLEGAKLIFQVRTRAPRGMQDSALSPSLAYVANKTQEIATINAALLSHGYDEVLGADFATELVNKGMIGSEVEAMLTSMDTMMDDMDSVESLSDFYDVMDAFMADVDNVEAVVSAFVNTVLVDALESEIADLEDEMDYGDDYFYSTDDLQVQLDMLQGLLDQIQDDPDAIVMTITTVIEYFMSVEEMITADLIANIEALAETEDAGSINVAELLVVKDEIVHILRETMPSQEDMLLMYNMYNVLVSMSGTTTINYDGIVEDYNSKMAAQSLMTLEAFINFLDGLDNAYFTTMISELNSNQSEAMMAAEVMILNVKYFDSYKADNDDLFDEMNEMFTDEEKEAMFDEAVTAFAAMSDTDSSTEMVSEMLSSVNFETLLELQIVLEEAFDAFLNAFVASDGEIIRQVAIAENYSYYYYDEEYQNYATDETFANYTEFRHKESLTNFEVGKEAVYLMDAVLQTVKAEDYQKALDFMFALIPSEDASMSDKGGMSLAYFGLMTVFQSAVDSSSSSQFELLQNVVEYLVDEDVFDDLAQLEIDSYNYGVSEYGADFRNSRSGYEDDSYFDYAELIFAAGVYDGFMTNANRGLVDDIVDAIAIALKDDTIQEESGMTDTEVDTMKTNVGLLLDFLSTEFDDIKDFNASNLTTSNLTTLEDFQDDLMTTLQDIVMPVE